MEAVILDFIDKTNDKLNALVKNFYNGIIKAGSVAHQINLNELTFMDCLGCTEDLFFVSDGECKCDDDFTKIYPFLKRSELWVFALDVSSKKQFKELMVVLNRMEPMFQINFNGTTSPPSKKIVSLLFSKFENSSEKFFVNVLEEFSKLFNYEFLGSVLRNRYNIFELIPESIFSDLSISKDYYNLGYELASSGSLNNALVKKLQGEIIPSDSLLSDILSFLKKY